jgi:hypothetical protein
MLPALIKYSSAAALLERFPEADRELHADDEACNVMETLAEDRAAAWMDDDDEDLAPVVGVSSKNMPALDASVLDALPL